MDLDQFPYYFVITNTPNLSHEKWILVYLDQYLSIKSKAIWDNYIHTIKNWRKILWQL